MSVVRKVVSGGQTGVDQAALRAAKNCGLEIGGWCPPGRGSEAGVIPAEFPLQETEQERSSNAPDVPRSQRTEWNVRDSDGTLVVRGAKEGAGTKWTIACANRYQRPLMITGVDDAEASDKIRQWLAANPIAVLNVAGPSEGTSPGIGAKIYTLLKHVFEL